MLLGKWATLILAATAAALGAGSFGMMSSGAPLSLRPNLVTALVVTNLSVFLMLVASLAGRLTRVWVERRRGSAGSRMHVRLVLLFSVVAVFPTILVGIFADRLVQPGHPAMVQRPSRTALEEGCRPARLPCRASQRHQTDALGMASDLERRPRIRKPNPSVFVNALASQTTLRGLTEAVIYEPDTGQVWRRGIVGGLDIGRHRPKRSRR